MSKVRKSEQLVAISEPSLLVNMLKKHQQKCKILSFSCIIVIIQLTHIIKRFYAAPQNLSELKASEKNKDLKSAGRIDTEPFVQYGVMRKKTSNSEV